MMLLELITSCRRRVEASNYVSKANHGLNLFGEMKEWISGF